MWTCAMLTDLDTPQLAIAATTPPLCVRPRLAAGVLSIGT